MTGRFPAAIGHAVPDIAPSIATGFRIRLHR